MKQDLLSQISSLDSLVGASEARLSFIKGQLEMLTRSLEETRKQILEEVLLVDLYARCSKILQGLSESIRSSVLKNIENIVSDALAEIYSKDFKFIVKFETHKIGQTIQFCLVDSLGLEYDILTSFGGGIKDIISTVLRIIVVELSVPKIEGPIILDETGRNISQNLQSNFGRFLSVLSHKLNRQIILITHQRDIMEHADKIIPVKSVIGRSTIGE